MRRRPLALIPLALMRIVPAHASGYPFDFLVFHHIMYADNTSGFGRSLRRTDLAGVFSHVRFRLAGSACARRSCPQRDGEALTLPVGTPVYRVRGYQPWFRLAAAENGSIRLFEAYSIPHARRGSDLLDLGGKVSWIGINSGRMGARQVASIRRPATVNRLVGELLRAPVNANLSTSPGPVYDLVFHLRDGTASVRLFALRAGHLQGGVQAPASVGSAIETALKQRR